MDCNLIDIFKMYFVLHYHGNYNNIDIDNMKMYEAEYYLNELNKIKEKELKAMENKNK